VSWKDFLKDYLSFTRKERIGIIIIVLSITGVIILPEFYSTKNNNPNIINDTAWFNAVKKLELKNAEPEEQVSSHEEARYFQFDPSKSSSSSEKIRITELFYFDPNTLSKEGWRKLGLKEKTIHTIQNYLSKGGHFFKAEELKKIYGLPQDEYERLFPFIKIEKNGNNKKEEEVSSVTEKEFQKGKKYIAGFSMIDINSADTTALISLPGIGSKLAGRIVNFRDKLGGFYSIEQIGETYGLPDSTFQSIKQYLKLDNPPLKKININTATLDEMKAHPYIKYSIANPIVAYRNEHGPFSKIEDIRNVMAITEDIYKKISPYLTVQ
jgi:competence ComEA-like helix-hairpin-helix protein